MRATPLAETLRLELLLLLHRKGGLPCDEIERALGLVGPIDQERFKKVLISVENEGLVIRDRSLELSQKGREWVKALLLP